MDVTTRTRRAELLAIADRRRLLEVAARCVTDVGDPIAISGPEVGMVMLTVREPVESIRFHLAEVLATRSEVEHRGARGWAMRLGDDPLATEAAAICDAELEADGPLRLQVESLCRDTEDAQRRRQAIEWAELSPTIVRFEEMGE